ncbi:DNA-binding response regulator [Lacrimispora amygdalina]|uniref:Stage 0 sporulation protein A homolog n=1 Tax=Lacrimispora amygdalina TaxID=253257 RepID=A0A3E2N4A4_9FIRM|nr:LytTR family DNA-binding domain-containing protein [Clostridium indicum]RFZ75802.1 DNA-binding response regulator [Clostridium indicum]
MLKIGVCDDDHLLLLEAETRLRRIGNEKEMDLDVETFCDGDEIVRAVYLGKRYDIIYMDIEMKRMNGLMAAERIREFDRMVQIVFMTSHQRYINQAFRSAPIGYLVKPVRDPEFNNNFSHIMNLIETKDLYYHFKYGRTECQVYLKKVLYFESKLRLTEIACEEGRHRLYKSLEEIENELKDRKFRFIRIHQSYLVSFSQIARFSNDVVELMDGTCLPVSRSRRKEVEEIMFETMGWCQI